MDIDGYTGPMPTATQRTDEVLDALDALCAALDENLRAAEQIRQRAVVIRAARAEGQSYRDIVEHADHPLVVELVSDKLERLFTAGSRLRRAEAAALHAEGLSMEAIGEIFGVTRQRVSALLKPLRGDEQLDRI